MDPHIQHKFILVQFVFKFKRDSVFNHESALTEKHMIHNGSNMINMSLSEIFITIILLKYTEFVSVNFRHNEKCRKIIFLLEQKPQNFDRKYSF